MDVARNNQQQRLLSMMPSLGARFADAQNNANVTNNADGFLGLSASELAQCVQSFQAQSQASNVGVYMQPVPVESYSPSSRGVDIDSPFSDMLSSVPSSSDLSDVGPDSPIAAPRTVTTSATSSVGLSAIAPAPTSSSGSPLPAVNMDPEQQKKLKYERKKERNRQAARKCRKQKIEREGTLDAKVRLMKEQNTMLTTQITQLRHQVTHLKQTVIGHIKRGCVFEG